MRVLSDREALYSLLDDLEFKTGGKRRLGDCHGNMMWPQRGVYFFFEPGEHRDIVGAPQRVVRVGTHALISNSRTTLWTRLAQHRGTSNLRGGNHRGSIFRLLVGEALLNSGSSPQLESWGRGASATRDQREMERGHEIRVSEYLSNMLLLFLAVPDEPGPQSARGIIERNSIALLSGYHGSLTDQPSAGWIGRNSGRERVRKSGLWNNRHVDERYNREFLRLFEESVRHFPNA